MEITSQINETANANSLSSIFKKPKPLLKTSKNKTTQSNCSFFLNCPSLPKNADSRVESTYSNQAASSKNIKNSVAFSSGGQFELTDDSVATNTNKKRRVSQQMKKSLEVSFSKSVDESAAEESVRLERKKGYLRQLRRSVKPSKDADFSAEISAVEGASAEVRSAKEVGAAASKCGAEDVSPPSPPPAILSPSSFSPPWNSTASSADDARRIRRCSTPLEGVLRAKRFHAEASLSLIPRALPFSDIETRSSSLMGPNMAAANSSRDDAKNGPSQESAGSRSSSSSAISSSNSVSFVTKVFHGEESMRLDSPENSPASMDAGSNRVRRIDADLRLKSVFPKFAPYCNKRFYKYLTDKMEPKYGIQTNRRVVRFSEKVHTLVQNIILKKTNHQGRVKKLQKLLYSRNIVCTGFDFYLFCLKFLPRDATLKIIPIIQPFGLPLLVDFDCQSVFEPIRLE